ncbi:MAG: trypsin-like peptidase domain-containing protein [Acidimicrobiia bacterium]|nr:trypsin-like peptidase domain-containing protein [Acidimicrobiia bacterium]
MPPFERDDDPWSPRPSGGGGAGGGRRISAAAVAALMLVSGGIGAGAAAAFRNQPANPQSLLPLQQDPGVLAPSPASPPTTTASTASVAAKVIPAVVDVNTHLSEGGAAAGTGMILSSSGEILTNNHVIEDASDIRVQISGTGPSYAAHVVGYDKSDDVALLQMDRAPSSLSTVKLGKSADLNVGDTVIAIGNALGRGGTPAVTQGVVTGLNQSVTAGDAIGPSNSLTGMIAMSAPLQEGDSGGPVVDTTGAVVGMNTAAAGGGRRTSSSVAFAVPIDRAMSVINQIRSGQGSATVHIGDRALLGVVLQDTSSGSGGGSASSAPGAAVSSVQPDGPAAKVGISNGDVITDLGGTPINSANDLTAAMGHYHPGDKVSVTWVDDSGRRHTATVQLIAGPPS